ncbi:MAG: site-specific integrase [Bradyrhizobium sp.]|nr:site-specific integrase [Bradyrhizobium sp.]
MKHVSTSSEVSATTLQDVLDCIVARPDMTHSRKRDLRSAVLSFSTLADKAPASIPLDLSDFRRVLDETGGTLAKVSAKRRANLRSDLVAAIEASGAHPMLKTGKLELHPAWKGLLDPIRDPRIRNGLSRFARWCSLNSISPEAVNQAAIDRFVRDLRARTLIRNVDGQRGAVVTAWNRLVVLKPELMAIAVPDGMKALKRVPWEHLPATFFADLQKHLAWCAMPDALDDDARATRLAPATIRLRRDQVHSAVTAAVAAGVAPESLRSLADLVGLGIFKTIMRKLYEDDGSVLTPYTHGVAGTLIAVAKESVGASVDEIAALKKLRRKLGTLPSGLTDKNKSFLRRFDDTSLSDSLLNLPDKLWRKARRGLSKSKRPFIDIQTSLAIDILLVIPLRMKNLASLSFRDHLHWPNGRGRPAMLIIEGAETKNGLLIEAELPTELADRLWAYRTEIAPAVIGKRPDALFTTTSGRPRTQGAVTVSIEKAVYRNIGIKLTPHQFRHFAAKLILDANPGAHELVRQLLVHKNMKTTTNYYAGINTLRAGRAHAELLMKLKSQTSAPRRKRSKSLGNDGSN